MPKVFDTEYYDVLGIKPDSGEKDIKKGFRKLAMKWHPDKWASASEEEKKRAETKFKEIGEAYETLSDDNKRKLYDQGGKDAIKGMNNGHSAGFHDMFQDIAKMFSGRMGGNRKKKVLKMPNFKIAVRVNMEQVYNGSDITFDITRYNLKQGAKPSIADISCKECKGEGKVMVTMQRGPGMIMQTVQPCNKCRGEGYSFPDKFFTKENKKFSQPLPKGIMSGQEIIVEDQGHQIPECFRDQYIDETSRTDIILKIEDTDTHEMKGQIFERGGINRSPFNIATKIKLSAHEGVCGTIINLPFLNGETISVKIPAGTVFENNNKMVIIPRLGMPVYKQKGKYGDLFLITEFENVGTIPHAKLQQIWELMSGTKMDDHCKSVLKNTNNEYMDSVDVDKYKQSGRMDESARNLQQFTNNIRNEKINRDNKKRGAEYSDSSDDDDGPGIGIPGMGGFPGMGGQPGPGCAQQ